MSFNKSQIYTFNFFDLITIKILFMNLTVLLITSFFITCNFLFWNSWLSTKIFSCIRRLKSSPNCGRKGKKLLPQKNENVKSFKSPRVVKGSKDSFRIVNGNLTTSRHQIPWQVHRFRYLIVKPKHPDHT